ncbi:hypothetical protein DSL92_06215 [Billgrantia gudaonensis]|uniref:Uncharacterized protein n=1 Tax=Billgrantia gudaonensis TaxID=376427 RepID=A0A432JIZ7_9GAMM|nr:hypothetical protein DSL92_06215 [Halomonas gudaonensis]
MVDENGNLVGLEPDLAALLAERMDVELELSRHLRQSPATSGSGISGCGHFSSGSPARADPATELLLEVVCDCSRGRFSHSDWTSMRGSRYA